MALMTCTKCGHRFSNQLPVCPICQQSSSAADSAEIKKMALRDFRTRMYHLKMISYLSLTLCTAGFIWYWNLTRLLQPVGVWTWVIVGIGSVSYLVLRLLMLRAKLKYRRQIKN